MWPNESFAAKAAADKGRDDMDLFFWNSECLGNCIASPDHPLRGFVQSQFVAVPCGHRSCRFHKIVMFERSDIGRFMLYRCTGVCSIGITALGGKFLAKELSRVVECGLRLLDINHRGNGFVID